MVYGETGRTYIEVHIKCRMIGFWLKIVKGSQCQYTFRLSFLRSIANCNNTPILSKWLSYIESILNNAGLGHVWQRQGEGLSDTWIINALKLRLTDIAKQDIMSKIWSNSVCINYRIFKTNILFEDYLLTLSRRDAILLCRLRCRSHRLPINNGRFKMNIEDIDIECPCCDLKVRGDEFHYIFICPFLWKKGRSI